MKKIILTLLILISIISVQANCQNVDLESLIPVPLLEDVSFVFATYDVYINNWQNGTPYGNVVFPDITADINGVKTCTCSIANLNCCAAPDTFTGTLTIGSIVYDGDVTINDFDITIDGLFGALFNWVLDFFENDFILALELEFGDCDYTCQVENDVCNEEFYCCENLECEYLPGEDYGYCQPITCAEVGDVCLVDNDCCSGLCDKPLGVDNGVCIAEQLPDPQIPEFTTIGAGLILIGVGLYLYKRKQ